MQFTSEHESLRDTVARFVDNEINPHVDAWEDADAVSAAAGILNEGYRKTRNGPTTSVKEVKR